MHHSYMCVCVCTHEKECWKVLSPTNKPLWEKIPMFGPLVKFCEVGQAENFSVPIYMVGVYIGE